MQVRALTVRQPWANLIAEGKKTLEIRTWKTKYVGALLICSSKTPKIEPCGMAVAVAWLSGVKEFLPEDAGKAHIAYEKGMNAWMLSDIRKILNPFPVHGKLGLFHVEPLDLRKIMLKRIV